MRIQVNGEFRDIPARLSLQELTIHLKLPTDRVAIELNHGVVRRAEWSTTILAEDDRVEIVQFVGGGHSDPLGVTGNSSGIERERTLRFESNALQ